MLRRIHFVLVVVSVVQTLVLCIPFRDPYAYYPFKELYRDPFKHRFSDPYSIVDRLAQAQARESNVRQSASLSSYQYRLPQNLKPTNYDLTVVPFLTEGNFTFYGKVIIGIDAVLDASEIVMNSKFLKIDSLLLTDESGVVIPCDYSLDESDERLIIRPQSSIQLVAGRSYIVIVEYTGQLLDDLYGFYRSSYKIGSEVKWLAATEFLLTYARRAFPCFDEPAFRARFTVRVGRFEYQNSVSNMPLYSTSGKRPEFDGRVIDTYEESPDMPTYIVAFCVSEMSSATSSPDGKLRISMRENAADQATYLMGIGENILNTIGDFVNIYYPLPVKVIAVPDFQAESFLGHYGITTYKEQYLLSEDGISNTKDNQGIMTAVAHGFSHQWFGNLVTPLWWNYTWLNEAFATYFEYTVADLVKPDWGMMPLFTVERLQHALQYDYLDGFSMTQKFPSDINTLNYAVCSKGASVLRMVEHFLTRPVFRTGINYYLTNASTSGIGTPERLFSALDAAAKEKNVLPYGITVANILNGWTTEGGSPLLTVTRTGNTITLSQTMLYGSIIGSLYIPLTYTSKSEGDFEDTKAKDWLLPGTNKTIHLVSRFVPESVWILFNIQRTGFYRVNYDVDNWRLLAQQLQTDLSRIHVINRAQLLDDAFILAAYDQLPLEVFLDLTVYLSQEREYAPWISVQTYLETILRVFAGTNAGNNFKDYVIRLLTPYYQYLAGTTNVTHQTSLGRLAFIKWACELDISECNTYAGNAFYYWFHNVVPIDADIRSAVLCAGVKQGGNQEWNAVWNLFMNNINREDRLILLDALGCSRSEDTITRYLDGAISPQTPIKVDDHSYVCDAVASRPTGIPPMIRFIVNNYETIDSKFGNLESSIFISLSTYVILVEHINQIRAVVNNDTLPAALRLKFYTTLQTAVRRRQTAVEYQYYIQPWLDQHGASVVTQTTNDGSDVTQTDASRASNVNLVTATTLICILTVFTVCFTCSSATFTCK